MHQLVSHLAFFFCGLSDWNGLTGKKKNEIEIWQHRNMLLWICFWIQKLLKMSKRNLVVMKALIVLWVCFCGVFICIFLEFDVKPKLRQCKAVFLFISFNPCGLFLIFCTGTLPRLGLHVNYRFAHDCFYRETEILKRRLSLLEFACEFWKMC